MKKRFFPTFLFTLIGLIAVGVLAVVIFTGKGGVKDADLSAPVETAGDGPDISAGATPEPVVLATEIPVTPAPTPEPTATPPATATPTVAPGTAALLKSIQKAMGEGRDGDVPELMAQLTELDPLRAADWSFILDYWRETESEGFIGGPLLPEGLPNDNSLCLVVFGYQLTQKGNMKAELIGRLETALACANQYPNAYVLVTGGGTASEKKNVTEAGEMAYWLKEKGIDKNRILVEDDSMTTGENVKYSYTLMSRHPEITSVAVITTDYHVPRCCLFFNTRFLMKGSPLRVVANAAFTKEPGKAVKKEPRKTIADGVASMYGV